MNFTPWDEMDNRQRSRIHAADTVIDDAAYLRGAIYSNEITFEQALMALLIAELRDLNMTFEYR